MTKSFRISALAVALSTAASGLVAQAINDNQMSDPRVRQAIAYAIDMDTIAETLFEGAAIPAQGILPNPAFKPDDLNPYAYDPDRARALLAEAGWDANRELQIVYYYGDQTTADFMAAIQAYLADVGIQSTYRLLEGDVGSQINTLPADPVNGPSALDWDILYGARAALALQEYFNRYAPGLSPTVPNVPELNTLVAQINSTTDPAVQIDGYMQLERIFNDQVYMLPLYYQQIYIVESDRLNRNGGAYGNEQYNYDWGVTGWTVEPNADGVAEVYTNNGPQQFFEVPWQNLGIWTHNKFAFDTILVADANLVPSGGELAETYSISEDGLTFSFVLRDGLTWHDGSPITGADVAWSIETAAKFPITHPVLNATFGRIEGAEAFKAGEADHISGIAVDGNAVTITFAEIDPNVLLTFSQFAPLPSLLLAGADPVELQQNEFWQMPVGSGPFQISEVRMNDYVVLTPFENYWGGVPQIERIVALPSFDGDPNLLVNAAAGRVDYAYTKNTTDVPQLEAMGNMRVTPASVNYTRLFWFNQFPRE